MRIALTVLLAVLPVVPLSGQDAAVRTIELPEPWGEHTPGVRTLVVTDSTRPDTISEAPDDHRTVLVRVWYPAEGEGSPRPYMAAPVADAWRNTLPAVDGFEGGIRTHGIPDAPLSGARERWPVLLFSPGRSFPVENYQIVLEHLASLGWVVAAMSPPYEEALTVLPDGRSFPFSGPTWESEEDRGPVLMGVVDQIVRDASTVLDRLAAVDADPGDAFHGRLALEGGVGYFGHSLGGAAAAWTLEREPRVVAASSWEGQVYRDEDRPLYVTGGPLLYFVGGANRDELAGTQFRSGRAGIPVHEAVIHGAWHASFGELLYVYRRYADRGWLERHRREVPAARVNQITGDYLHEFFSVHLLGGEPDLLWPDSRAQLGTTDDRNYPEVELRTWVR